MSATPDPREPAAPQPPSKVHAWVWPGFIIGLLLTHVLICFVMAAVAVSDPSDVVVDNYYSRALHWDDAKAAARASSALGWKSAVQIGDALDPLGRRQLTLTIIDDTGNPVEGAAASVRAFHQAHARNVLEENLTDEGRGRYAVWVPVRRPGLWRLHFEVRRGADRYLHEEIDDVRAARRAAP